MIDIIVEDTGLDLGTLDTQTYRAANLLSVQLGALEYAQDIGIDLKYFLSQDFKFQNESFKAYLVQRLADQAINVASVIEVLSDLYSTYTFNLSADQLNSGLVAR